jgi:chemotaxis protein MotB
MANRQRLKSRGGGEEGWLLSYADLITNLLIFFVMLLSASQVSTVKMQRMSQSLSGKKNTTSLSQIKKEMDASIAKDHLESTISTRMTDDGLEISLNSGVVFDQGSAEIRTEWDPVLKTLLARLSPYTEKYRIAIEGHTDNLPITSSRFPSNWELSSERAMQVRQRLENSGVKSQKMRVEAYGETKPPPAKDLLGLNEEQANARRRRVVVRLF